jgi:hypothetical protein
VISSTVRDAASQLATAFRDRYQRSPLHVNGSTKLLPSVRAFLRAFDNVDPLQNRQRAVTPKFLKALLAYCQATYARDSIQCHAADLMVAAFFFAMRACEYTRTARPGHTKIAVIKYVIFRDRTRRVLSHRDPELQNKAYFITLVFANHKNGKKRDARTQQRTGDPFLCPAIHWAAVIQRLMRTVPDFDEDTPVCTWYHKSKPLLITSTFVHLLMRSVCSSLRGKEEFGFGPADTGNKYIRSGLAMALFLANHSPAKIMILGGWVSDAFLVYIQSQVLEWTNTMLVDMINVETFLDAAFDMTSTDDPRTRTILRQSFDGRDLVVTMPKFHLYH